MDYSARYVITGGPGAGKTTLVNGLAELGYACSPEVSRRVIIDEVSRHSDCLPWKDISCFSDKVLKEMRIAWANAVPPLTFFDRAIPDIIAYLKIAGIPVPEHYLSALAEQPYHKQVFILPPWEKIYVTDSERWQSFEEASRIYDMLRSTYEEFGYALTELPRAPLAERMEFVFSFIK
jgi:predicted ATPase